MKKKKKPERNSRRQLLLFPGELSSALSDEYMHTHTPKDSLLCIDTSNAARVPFVHSSASQAEEEKSRKIDITVCFENYLVCKHFQALQGPCVFFFCSSGEGVQLFKSLGDFLI